MDSFPSPKKLKSRSRGVTSSDARKLILDLTIGHGLPCNGRLERTYMFIANLYHLALFSLSQFDQVSSEIGSNPTGLLVASFLSSS